MLGKGDDVADGGPDGMRTSDSAGLPLSTAAVVFFANQPLIRGCNVQNCRVREPALSIAPGGGGPEDRRGASVKLSNDGSNPLSSPRWSSPVCVWYVQPGTVSSWSS